MVPVGRPSLLEDCLHSPLPECRPLRRYSERLVASTNRRTFYHHEWRTPAGTEAHCSPRDRGAALPLESEGTAASYRPSQGTRSEQVCANKRSYPALSRERTCREPTGPRSSRQNARSLCSTPSRDGRLRSETWGSLKLSVVVLDGTFAAAVDGTPGAALGRTRYRRHVSKVRVAATPERLSRRPQWQALAIDPRAAFDAISGRPAHGRETATRT